jgi:CxxC motif-containing protein
VTRELTCITCPIGCRLAVDASAAAGAEGELSVSGNRCPRGAAYAREELLAPKRTVTATIRSRTSAVESSGVRRIPCRTDAPFPKERVDELLAAIYCLEASLPVKRGQVLIADALGLGIDVVATRSLT